MAQRQEKRKLDKAELVSALETSRTRLASDIRGLGYELDYKSKLKTSIRSHTGSWLTGAAATGLVLSLFPRKKKKVVIHKGDGHKQKKVKKSRNLAWDSLRLAFPLAKPLLLAFATKKVNSLVSRIEKE